MLTDQEVIKDEAHERAKTDVKESLFTGEEAEEVYEERLQYHYEALT